MAKRFDLSFFFFVSLRRSAILLSFIVPSLVFGQVNKLVKVGDTVRVKVIDIPDAISFGYHVPPRFTSMKVWHTNDNFLLHSEKYGSLIEVYAMPWIAGTHTDSITVKAHYVDSWYAGAFADCTYSYAITVEAVDSLLSHVSDQASGKEFAIERTSVTLNDPSYDYFSMDLVDLLGRSVASTHSTTLPLDRQLAGQYFLVIRYRDRTTIRKLFLD